MKLAEMWKTVEIPVYIMIGYSLIIYLLVGMEIVGTSIQSWLGWVVSIGVFGYIGYLVKKAKGTAGDAAKHGALAGAVVGFVGGILGIISYYYFPNIYADAINQAVAAGAPRDTVETMISITVYFGLLLGPIFQGIIGAVISAIGNAISK